MFSDSYDHVPVLQDLHDTSQIKGDVSLMSGTEPMKEGEV